MCDSLLYAPACASFMLCFFHLIKGLSVTVGATCNLVGFSWVETTWSDLAWILDIHRYIYIYIQRYTVADETTDSDNMKSVQLLDRFLPNRCNIPAIAIAAIPMASAIGCKDCLDNHHVRDSIDDRKSTSEGSPANLAAFRNQYLNCFISGLTSISESMDWILFTCLCLFNVSSQMLFWFLSKAQYSCSCCRCYCLVWFPQLGCHTIPLHPHSLNDLTVTVQSKKCQNLFVIFFESKMIRTSLRITFRSLRKVDLRRISDTPVYLIRNCFPAPWVGKPTGSEKRWGSGNIIHPSQLVPQRKRFPGWGNGKASAPLWRLTVKTSFPLHHS